MHLLLCRQTNAQDQSICCQEEAVLGRKQYPPIVLWVMFTENATVRLPSPVIFSFPTIIGCFLNI